MAMGNDQRPGTRPAVNIAVLQALEPYLDELADRIAERMQAARGRMVNQHDSELGSRRHRAAVQRRMANGEGGAGRAGRNHLLTPDAIREELARGRGSEGAPAAAGGGDGSPGKGGSGGKSRTRELNDFERDVIAGLRAVKEHGR